MPAKYPNLASLLKADSGAARYYESLPQYVREQIASRGDGVNSLESLRSYADNLTKGDG